MLFSTMHQGRLFLWMMMAGATIGVWYGVTAALRRLMQAGFWLTLGCDLLFGLGAAVILCGALIAGNWGVIRPFALLGAMIGAFLSLFGLMLPLDRLLSRLLRAMKRFFAALRNKALLKFLLK